MSVRMLHEVIVVISMYLAIGASLARAHIYPPISVPRDIPGQRYPHDSIFTPNVRLEAFLELNCPDSFVELPILEQIVEHYGASELDLVIHQLPLPYHRNGMISTQGLYVIRDNLPHQSFNYMHEILNNWMRFSTTATENMVDWEILELLANHTNAATGIDKTFFKSEIEGYSDEAKQNWKFGVRRGVAGTPWFFLNGVDLSVVGNPTFDDWIAYLDPILTSQNPVEIYDLTQLDSKDNFIDTVFERCQAPGQKDRKSQSIGNNLPQIQKDLPGRIVNILKEIDIL